MIIVRYSLLFCHSQGGGLELLYIGVTVKIVRIKKLTRFKGESAIRRARRRKLDILMACEYSTHIGGIN